MRLSLLPPDRKLGWTPYAWLVYLAGIVLYLVLGRATAAEWMVGGAVIATFLLLYFRAFWFTGRALLPYLAGIAALAMLYAPFNPGAAAFFIYAAAFLGQVGRPAVAVRWLLGLVALIGIETWLLGLPVQTWLPAVVFSLLIGGTNIHFAERERANARLARAHGEIEHLAQVAERERIARDLHDLLGHTLSLVVLKAELAGKLAARDPERAAAEIRDVERIARAALSEVREAVQGYRTRDLEHELASAREALAAAGVAVEAELAPLRLTAAEEGILALALREAVTNVVRHAGARSCAIRLTADGHLAALEIADDGGGGDAADGSGLTGMRERVAALGGEVARHGGNGTRLRVTLPLASLVPAELLSEAESARAASASHPPRGALGAPAPQPTS